MLLQRRKCTGKVLTAGTFLTICLLCTLRAHSQARSILDSGALQTTGSITVSVKDDQGAPLTVTPAVFVTAVASGSPPMDILSRNQSGQWVFTNLVVGARYVVKVKAWGFETAQRLVDLPNVGDASVRIRFFLVPSEGRSGREAPAGGTILAPRARRQVQQGVKDLEAKRINSAQKHLSKALKMAPGNPLVNYLMGACWLRAGKVKEATKYLENALSLDPKQTQALLALGTVRYQQGDMAKAIELLTQAVESEPQLWRAHWLLAAASLRERNYRQARQQADAALKYGKERAAPARLILGVALAKLGKRDEALRTFNDYLWRYPDDPRDPKIRRIVEQLGHAQSAAH